MHISSEDYDLLMITRQIVTLCRAHEAPSSANTAVYDLLNQMLKGQITMSENITKLLDEQSKLQADVAAQTTVIASATTALTGLASLLAAAEAEAKASGVTAEQIAGFSSVRASLETNTAALAAAIPQNTPAAAPVPAPSDAISPVPTPEPVVPAAAADTTAQPAPAPGAVPAENAAAAPTGTATPL